MDDQRYHVADVKDGVIYEILKSIRTCPVAYAVFKTETMRDAAVDASAPSGGIESNGKTITLTALRVEPQSVQWPGCAVVWCEGAVCPESVSWGDWVWYLRLGEVGTVALA